MKLKVKNMLDKKDKTVPILSFPSVNLLGISVNELITSSDMQAKGMQAIVDRCNVGASLNMMDLSVEAEAFGATIQFYEDDIPTVEDGIIDDISEVDDIVVPKVGEGRTDIYIQGVKKAKETIKDVPVFCGVIGPYSLAGRLFDMTELMMECYDSPDEVHTLLSKTSEFILEYIKAFKAAGADGVVMAEPAAGLLSPAMAEEFSTEYVKKIFDEVNDDDFVLCYHNCGNTASDMGKSLSEICADIFHFGNAVDIKRLLEEMPKDRVVMGNVDPVLFRTATPADIENEVERVYQACSEYDNFMLSTGCDVPAEAKWENIDTYFKKVKKLYASDNH